MKSQIVPEGHAKTTREENKRSIFSISNLLPQLAISIGLLESSALQKGGHIKPIILQRRTPRETNPTGH
jgi:hypothetical protein